MFIVCFLTCCGTAIAFIVYWWKKRNARLSAEGDYHADERYKSVSLRKRIIGVVCVISFFGMFATAPTPTPEEHAAYQAKKEQEKVAKEAEEKRIADEKAAKEAEEKRLADEKAAKETEEKRLADEKAAKEAEEKRLADEKAAKEAEEPGLWDRAKSFVGGVVSNEVHVCDKGDLSYYIIPSTKKRKDVGLIFKDEGYEIEVVCKSSDGKVRSSRIYQFCKRSDDTVEWCTEDSKWQRIKHTYSEFEENFHADLGKLIYDASNKFPNL